MAITGATPEACFKTFRDHLAPVVAATLTATHPLRLIKGHDENRRTLQLGSERTVPLESRNFGRIHFGLAQDLEAVPRKGAFQLRTRHYWYTVLGEAPGLTDEPLFRWEYVSDLPAGKHWCKHHFQIGKVANPERSQAVTLRLGNGFADLNKLHVPTGYVLIEYVIRFLITDLDVQSRSSDWESVLSKSESKFFREFSGKTS